MKTRRPLRLFFGLSANLEQHPLSLISFTVAIISNLTRPKLTGIICEKIFVRPIIKTLNLYINIYNTIMDYIDCFFMPRIFFNRNVYLALNSIPIDFYYYLFIYFKSDLLYFF